MEISFDIQVKLIILLSIAINVLLFYILLNPKRKGNNDEER